MKGSRPIAIQKRRMVSRVETRLQGETLMKSILHYAFAVLVLTGISAAREVPDAPSPTPDVLLAEPANAIPVSSTSENKVVNVKFLSLAIISTGSTFADSYTTLFARENWLAGRKGVCNAEVESAYLYGTHPTVGRAYAVASVKSAGSIFASYYLRKHHSKLWSLPLLANSVISLQGTTQNMITCN
jgi:hypothetical protein